MLAVGETDCELENAFVPVNVPPEAVHDVALVDDHVSVELCPAFIEVGDAVSVTIGAGVVGGGVEPLPLIGKPEI